MFWQAGTISVEAVDEKKMLDKRVGIWYNNTCVERRWRSNEPLKVALRTLKTIQRREKQGIGPRCEDPSEGGERGGRMEQSDSKS